MREASDIGSMESSIEDGLCIGSTARQHLCAHSGVGSYKIRDKLLLPGPAILLPLDVPYSIAATGARDKHKEKGRVPHIGGCFSTSPFAPCTVRSSLVAKTLQPLNF